MNRASAAPMALCCAPGVVPGCAGAARAPLAPLPDAPRPRPRPRRRWSFRSDAGPHDALTEWWYYTGHLTRPATATPYGFEFTIFQVAPPGRSRPATWPTSPSRTSTASAFSHQARFAPGPSRPRAFRSTWTAGRSITDGTSDTLAGGDARRAGRRPAVRPAPAAARTRSRRRCTTAGTSTIGPAGGSYYYSRTRLSVTGVARQRRRRRRSTVIGHGLDGSPVGQLRRRRARAAGTGTACSSTTTPSSCCTCCAARHGRDDGVYGTHVLADGRSRDLAPGSVTSVALGHVDESAHGRGLSVRLAG